MLLLILLILLILALAGGVWASKFLFILALILIVALIVSFSDVLPASAYD